MPTTTCSARNPCQKPLIATRLLSWFIVKGVASSATGGCEQIQNSSIRIKCTTVHIAPRRATVCLELAPQIDVVHKHSAGNNRHEVLIRQDDTLPWLQPFEGNSTQLLCYVCPWRIHTLALHPSQRSCIHLRGSSVPDRFQHLL
jgi:hypothetical protein